MDDNDLFPPAPSASESAAETPVTEPEHKGGFFKELPVLILIAFGLALIIKTFLVQAFFIPSESMVPTLEIGDRVMVNKLVYRVREPRRGEIMVFIAEKDQRQRSALQKVRSFLFEGLGVTTPKERDFIKRVIALPGETIRVKGAKVTITTKDKKKIVLTEPYLNGAEDDDSTFGPFTVPAKSFFVMGDNRANSADSRTKLGPIARSDIVGKAFIRIWPAKRFGFFRRPSYAATALGAQLIPFPLVIGLGYVRRRRRRSRAA
jgi:signal peptidase I